MVDLDRYTSIRPKSGVVVVPVDDLLSLLDELKETRERVRLLTNPPKPSFGLLPAGSKVFVQAVEENGHKRYDICAEGSFDLWFNSFESEEEAEQEIIRNGWKYGLASIAAGFVGPRYK